MQILSEKWITTKCQPPDLRAWVADRAAVARLGPDNPAAASGTSHHPPPSPPRRIGCSFGSSLDQKLTPTPLAAAVVYAPFQAAAAGAPQCRGSAGSNFVFGFWRTIAALPGGWDLAHGGLAGDSSIYRGGLAVVGGIGRAG